MSKGYEGAPTQHLWAAVCIRVGSLEAVSKLGCYRLGAVRLRASECSDEFSITSDVNLGWRARIAGAALASELHTSEILAGNIHASGCHFSTLSSQYLEKTKARHEIMC